MEHTAHVPAYSVISFIGPASSMLRKAREFEELNMDEQKMANTDHGEGPARSTYEHYERTTCCPPTTHIFGIRIFQSQNT